MKSFANFLIVLAVLLLLIIASKPTDRKCLQETTDHYAGTGGLSSFLQSTGISSAAIAVQDYGLYKGIYNRINGRQIGIGIANTVIFLN